MRMLLTALFAATVLAACGGGGGTNLPPTPSSQLAGPDNGAQFTLAFCVPVYNVGSTNTLPSPPPTSVGSACSGENPLIQHGMLIHSYVINGNAAVSCDAELSQGDVIQAFMCNGNPFS